MKKRYLAVLVACLLIGLSPAAFGQGKVHHVVFAVTSGEEVDWQMTLGNIRNLIAGLKPDTTEVEVIAYAKGLSLVKKDSTVAAEIAALQEQGVRFVACQNSMRMQHVELKDLLAGVEPVPSGIVELVKKQEAGWTYVKGGR
jgi:intracellular sulfur oxidation DsrE/DsrF family protein